MCNDFSNRETSHARRNVGLANMLEKMRLSQLTRAHITKIPPMSMHDKLMMAIKRLPGVQTSAGGNKGTPVADLTLLKNRLGLLGGVAAVGTVATAALGGKVATAAGTIGSKGSTGLPNLHTGHGGGGWLPQSTSTKNSNISSINASVFSTFKKIGAGSVSAGGNAGSFNSISLSTNAGSKSFGDELWELLSDEIGKRMVSPFVPGFKLVSVINDGGQIVMPFVADRAADRAHANGNHRLGNTWGAVADHFEEFSLFKSTGETIDILNPFHTPSNDPNDTSFGRFVGDTLEYAYKTPGRVVRVSTQATASTFSYLWGVATSPFKRDSQYRHF
jgi:hypothetical protein